MGVPTFMQAAFSAGNKDVDIAMVGVPHEGSVTKRPRARSGPREFRNQSSFVRNIHHVCISSPFKFAE